MTSTKSEAAAAVRIGAGLALRKRNELLGLLRPCFARTEPWLQAGKYVSALVSELPRVNGWSIARRGGDRTPDRTQRLLNHASWDTFAAMSVVRRFAAAGLEQAVRRRRGGMTVGAVDETGQEKAGEATAGVKRQYMGCAGRVANGINTVHLSYVRDKAGHALIGARQWIPREHIADPVKSLLTGLPPDLGFRTKGQLAIDIFTAAYADGIRFDFACGDEVYGNCTQLREFFEAEGQAYVLRVPSNFTLALAAGAKLTCAQAVTALLKHERRWETRSAGSGSKGERWYAWAWIATASPRHHLLVRRHLKTGELAFHYCYVPEGQVLTKTRLIRAAGLRWPVEEDFAFGKDCFGLDQCQARLYTAIARHLVLVMAALAVCAITAAMIRDRTDTQAPPPVRPDQPPPAEPGMIPLTIPEIKRLLAALTIPPLPLRHVIHWDAWTRRHQARSRWFHKRARLARDADPPLVSSPSAAALLDVAVTRMLMYKVGGGYAFTHRLLLEYFASIDSIDVADHSHYATLAKIDLRPEVLMNSALAEARNGTRPVADALAYLADTIPVSEWLPVAAEIADILENRLFRGSPWETGDLKRDDLLGVLVLMVNASDGETSLATTVRFAEAYLSLLQKAAPPSRITWEQAVVKSLQTARESGHAVWAPRAEATLNDIVQSRTRRQPLWTWG